MLWIVNEDAAVVAEVFDPAEEGVSFSVCVVGYIEKTTNRLRRSLE